MLRRTGRPDVAVPGVLQSIAACESGGNPRAVGGGGTFRGKYQFDYGTWAGVGGSGDPAAAPEAEQDRRAALLYARGRRGALARLRRDSRRLACSAMDAAALRAEFPVLADRAYLNAGTCGPLPHARRARGPRRARPRGARDGRAKRATSTPLIDLRDRQRAAYAARARRRARPTSR